jgi:hypothetical protein
MNTAHAAALASPLTTPTIYPEQIHPLTHDRRLPSGDLLRVILVVDADDNLIAHCPFWHACVSIMRPGLRHRVHSASLVERCAISALADVGGDREWWRWDSRTAIGYLRIPLTSPEIGELAAWPHQHDAKPYGIERARVERLCPSTYMWIKRAH